MKTQTQHTPGPWATSRDAVPEWHTQITVYEEATGKRVATVFETPANAALIQAAPEMAECLAQQLENIEGDLEWAQQQHDTGAIATHRERMKPIRNILSRLNP